VAKKRSFIGQIIADAWTVAVEHAKYKKAMRILVKQEWSLEFLQELVRKAPADVQLKITNGPMVMYLSKGTVLADPPKGSDITNKDLMDYLQGNL